MLKGVTKTGLGQDSHRFAEREMERELKLGGFTVPGHGGLAGNSDADVVLHAVTNAVSGVSGINILGEISDRMCFDQRITDSREYLIKAMETLPQNFRITHLSVSIECKRPKLAPYISDIKQSLSTIMEIDTSDIGITATSGEGLTSFGCGEGIQVFAALSVLV